MIGVTASMITQLLPAVIAVTVPMSRVWLTKAGVTSGIVAGLAVALSTRPAFYGGLLPEGIRFDPSFWGLVVNVPVAFIVSRFTAPPNADDVARIRAALDEEFRPT